MKKTDLRLIPDCQNPSPDYYCTWQTQLYATCDGKPEAQRAAIGEKALFDREKPFGWAYFYEKARKDLILVMDDSWDVPYENDGRHYGSLLLSRDKFPEATSGADNAEALKRLTDRAKALGWKGLGGWVCAQEAPALSDGLSPEEYWRARLSDAAHSGFCYWKVDWGRKKANADFRRTLTDMGRTSAPELVIEHAMIEQAIPYSDVFRTYDVPAIMSIPMTMEKLAKLSCVPAAAPGYAGLINCEDEAYMAAALGCVMGIMRHPYAGGFTDGRPDMSFPACHRNLKTKMYEVIRAVNWHKLSPAFAWDGAALLVDEKQLTDTWRFEDRAAELEAWWFDMPAIAAGMAGDTLSLSAPARLSRGCPLPLVLPDPEGRVPYVVASRAANGALAVATLGRTEQRSYGIPHCHITLAAEQAALVGVFGEYLALTLETSHKAIRRILMQDLAGLTAVDVTEDATIDRGRITLPGELIHRIGTESQPSEDTSEPAVVIKIEIS